MRCKRARNESIMIVSSGVFLTVSHGAWPSGVAARVLNWVALSRLAWLLLLYVWCLLPADKPSQIHELTGPNVDEEERKKKKIDILSG
jgi:hypothetical protein